MIFLNDEVTELEATLTGQMVGYSKRFIITVVILVTFILIGLFALFLQFTQGLVVTGLTHKISWGFYMSAFVYFIGISYGGILVSGILRITGAEWRRPITRLAETITVFSLLVGASMVIIDMGRPERILNVYLLGRIESPILWDMLAITTYLIGSLLYLYLPLIPDLAVCRDRLSNVSRFRKKLYSMLSLGWRGNLEQKKLLDKSIFIMAVVMIPVAISVHTVVGWIFGMTLRPGWHSTIFGPYFVTGAIYTGIACIIIALAIVRKVYHLERYLTEKHFNLLGLLLFTLSLGIIYMTVSEYLTVWYGAEDAELKILDWKFHGRYALMFWSMIIGGFILPAVILAFKVGRTVTGTVIAALLVNYGMFTERFLIVIPTMEAPFLPYGEIIYSPTWVEFMVMFMGLSIIILGIVLFTKFFPIISIWEIKEGLEVEKSIESEYKKPPEQRVPLEKRTPQEVEEMEELFID